MSSLPTLYLDLCCLNRPFDDQHQVRIRVEAEAVLALAQLARTGQFNWVSSEVLQLEASRNPNMEKRDKIQALLDGAKSSVTVGPNEEKRAKELEEMGFGEYDALHIACAEAAKAEVLLTTDDRLRNRAIREAAKMKVRVENPAKWYAEVIINERGSTSD